MIFDESLIAEYDGLGRLRRKFLYGTGIDEIVRMTVIEKSADIAGGDGKVDFEDLHVLADNWLSRKFDPFYSAEADYDGDGVVDWLDLKIMCDNWLAPVNGTDFEDFAVLANSWLHYQVNPYFNDSADLNGDGRVDFEDFAMLAEKWGAGGLTGGEYNEDYYYHYDGLGSVVALSNASGNLVEQYQYDAFGKPIIRNEFGSVVSVSSVANRFMFTAREYDSETGNYYYRARYYSPITGRFLQSDPIGYKGGLNLYAYCGNNPVILVDPYGLCGQSRSKGYDWSSAFSGLGSSYRKEVANNFSNIVTAPGDYYSAFRESGIGPVASAFQAANMSVGKVVGYSNIAESMLGWDLRSAQDLSTGQRVWRGAIGTVQTATFAVAAANTIHAAAPSTGLTTVSRYGSSSEGPGWVMKGEASPSNYFRSGKWDPLPSNEFAGPSSGHSWIVPGESLSYPSGSEAWKGLLGQRMYNPHP